MCAATEETFFFFPDSPITQVRTEIIYFNHDCSFLTSFLTITMETSLWDGASETQGSLPAKGLWYLPTRRMTSVFLILFLSYLLLRFSSWQVYLGG